VKTATSLGGKPINRMGFGAMQLAGPGVFGPPRDPRAARAVLRRAVELGVDHIDTSQYYGPDVVNDLIREALHPYPEELKLVTKVGWRRDGAGRVLPAQTPGELREVSCRNPVGSAVDKRQFLDQMTSATLHHGVQFGVGSSGKTDDDVDRLIGLAGGSEVAV